MSEYQYYEFLAVDKPLTPAQMEAVGRYSSRADISSTSFSNEYNYGDFRGDVDKFLTQYFDLHVYVANWGTHTLALALPEGTLDLPVAKPYAAADACHISRKQDRLLLNFTSQEEGGDWESGGDEWMARLAPIREELLSGDLRALYLAWLVAVQESLGEEDAPEPPIPAGLKKLTAAQQAFVEFMRLDSNLLDIAAELSPERAHHTPDLRAWLTTIRLEEKDAALLALLEGRSAEVARDLQSRLRKFAPAGSAPAASGRTAAILWKAAEALSEERARVLKERQARERARKAAEAAAVRQLYLRDLAPRRDEIWAQVEQLITTKLPKNYDQAVTLLIDLRDLAAAADNPASFATPFAALRQKHSAKSTLQKRFQKIQVAAPLAP